MYILQKSFWLTEDSALFESKPQVTYIERRELFSSICKCVDILWTIGALRTVPSGQLENIYWIESHLYITGRKVFLVKTSSLIFVL